MLRAAEEHYAQQAALAALVHRRVGQLWSRVPAEDFNAWSALLPQAVSLVGAAQVAAATAAEGYVAAALEEQGSPVDPVGVVVPAAFMGASDGRPLVSLLDQPRITALTGVDQGMSGTAALQRAGRQLQMLTVTQVQDAGRQADSVAIAARPKVGWVRMVQPPCCSRCAILAGKWFKANQGFQRHPRCDCRHVPMAETDRAFEGEFNSTAELFTNGGVTDVTASERRAIADGADPNQVINARRGRSGNGMWTTEGTTRRGVASESIRDARAGRVTETAVSVGPRGANRNYTERRVRRATPDAIYRYSSSPEEARRLLAEQGYIR